MKTNGDICPAILDLETTVEDQGLGKTYQNKDSKLRNLTTQKWEYKK